MIGANSIIKNFTIPNVRDKKQSFEVIVQANKNYGICDVFIPHDFVAPVKPEIPTKESNARYKAEKVVYDAHMAHIKAIRNSILDEFQGRQLNSDDVQIHLANVLYAVMN